MHPPVQPEVHSPAKPKPARKRLGWPWKLLFSLLFFALLLEVILRVQQKLGPWIDLEMPGIHAGIISDELNHRPEISARWPYDDNGLIQYSEELLPSSVRHNPHAWKILFMGDSFMQGFGGKEEIPWQVMHHYQLAGIPMIPLNAGYYSYSPSIFIVLARKLLPLVKPDAIVVVIDNTDLGDDAWRYRDLVARDAEGKITAVKSNPSYAFFIQGFLDIQKQPLYLTRFVSKLIHTRYSHPRFDGGKTYRVSEWIEDSIIDQSPDLETRYAEEVKIFEANLREFADILIHHTGTGQRILWVCHPNPFHLRTPEGKVPPNRLVMNAVERIAAEKKIHFYDATSDMRRDLGPNPEKYYLKGDPVYHFIPEACLIYAKNIFNHIPPEWKQPK